MTCLDLVYLKHPCLDDVHVHRIFWGVGWKFKEYHLTALWDYVLLSFLKYKLENES